MVYGTNNHVAQQLASELDVRDIGTKGKVVVANKNGDLFSTSAKGRLLVVGFSEPDADEGFSAWKISAHDDLTRAFAAMQDAQDAYVAIIDKLQGNSGFRKDMHTASGGAATSADAAAGGGATSGRLRVSSKGKAHVDRVNAERESHERLAMWAALAESLAYLLIRTEEGSSTAPDDWLYGPPVAMFGLLSERLNAMPVPGEAPPHDDENVGHAIVRAWGRMDRHGGSGAFLYDEVAAETPAGARLAARAKRALPIVSSYRMVFTADNGNELRDDFESTWSAIHAWRIADRAARTPSDVEVSPEDLDLLRSRIDVDMPRPLWPPWSARWIEQIEAAVLESIYSRDKLYSSDPSDVVDRWRRHRQTTLNDLSALAEHAERPDLLLPIIDSYQVLHQTEAKASAAARGAKALLRVGVRHASDMTGGDEERAAWCSVEGLDESTWTSFTTALGVPGPEADLVVREYVSDALGRDVTPVEARNLTTAVAHQLSGSTVELDFAIRSWRRAEDG